MCIIRFFFAQSLPSDALHNLAESHFYQAKTIMLSADTLIFATVRCITCSTLSSSHHFFAKFCYLTGTRVPVPEVMFPPNRSLHLKTTFLDVLARFSELTLRHRLWNVCSVQSSIICSDAFRAAGVKKHLRKILCTTPTKHLPYKSYRT